MLNNGKSVCIASFSIAKVIWLLKVNLLSKITPRYQTCLVHGILLEFIVISVEYSSGRHLVSRIASDFSSFNFKFHLSCNI